MPYRPPEYVRLLAQAVDAKANYFPGHSDGVAYILRLMCSEGGLSADHTQQIGTAAMLHDIGKLAIPDRILNAARKLDAAEWEEMKKHPLYSERVARSVGGHEYAAPWVRHHHEHWDGSGYPDGCAGTAIPMESRMILVADAFHVMTNDRPYQRARTRREALDTIMDLRGKQFCPDSCGLLLGAMHNSQDL